MHRLWWYSRGIRQTLLRCAASHRAPPCVAVSFRAAEGRGAWAWNPAHRLAHEDRWWDEHRILIGDKGQIHDEYSASLARSKFCFVLPGDGWSGRAEDAVLHGEGAARLCGGRTGAPPPLSPGASLTLRAPDLPASSFPCTRAFQAGCIPVVIQDRVEPPLHGVLDWEQFSVRIAEANMTRVPEILKSFTDEQVASMQRALHKVWHR